MKKLQLIILFVALVAQSCSPRLMPREVNTMFFDYRQHAAEGFFISPDPYTGSFTPCGELIVTIKPGDVVKARQVYDPGTQGYEMVKDIHRESINPEELLDIAVKKAKELGANGLVNFECLVINTTLYNPVLKNIQTVFSHYEISGYAIKRNMGK